MAKHSYAVTSVISELPSCRPMHVQIARDVPEVGMSNDDIVKYIRSRCAAEFGLPVDYDFFKLNYLLGEPADAALLRAYFEERPNHESMDDTIDALIFG